MTADDGLDAIPHPPSRAFVGNMFDIDASNVIESLGRLAREYGPIYRLDAPNGSSRLIVSGFSLVDEYCDEARFDKTLGPGVATAGGSGSQGLFTAMTDDPNWSKAHNILLPNFSMAAMQRYYPMMLDLAVQLCQKWERLNPDEPINVAGDMTRLTLDTIALCGFGYRFNSFYRDTPHPFVAAMVRALAFSQHQSQQLPIQAKLSWRARRQAQQDNAFMAQTVDALIEDRRARGVEHGAQDLLSCMLTGVDPQSGEPLDDENIRAQCITFLVAGHETTSGLLSFATYALLKHPDVLARAYEEVDRVLGTDPSALPTYAQTHQLAYVTQILNEALRLWPTAPAFSRTPYEDTVVGGKYPVTKGSVSTILLSMLHRDTSIWGDDAEDFNPDHFAPEREAQLPANAFKPFGTGQRGCIGRQFAMQEAVLVLGMLLQRFEFVDVKNYQLAIKQTLTIKPHGLEIQVRPRSGRTASALLAPPNGRGSVATQAPAQPLTAPAPSAPTSPAAGRHGTPLLVLFGSNLGTAEGIARGIAQDGTSRGFSVTLGALDEHAGRLPTSGAVVIIAASYNGAPPNNAVTFCSWLRDGSLGDDALAGVAYTIFGCGHRDWAATYQAIPTLIDTQLAAHGARRVYQRGEGDARGDFDGQYRAWYGGLWEALAGALKLPASVTQTHAAGPRFALTFTNRLATSPTITSYSAVAVPVRANRELQRRDGERPSERSTRHIEIGLPAGLSYATGDHLGILPRNGPYLLQRVFAHFKLDASLYVTITPSAEAATHLPVNEPVPLIGILANLVELQDVATRPQLAILARHTGDPEQQAWLQARAGDDDESLGRYTEDVVRPRTSVLDLLEAIPACDLPFEAYLEMLPPMRPRYYSISSSPLASPDACSITVGVVEGAARSGRGTYRGVGSTYLASRPLGSTVFAFVRRPTIPFEPPANPHLPMLMIGPGTGLAPFRGFLQERAALKQRGVPVGEALLFFGCRDPQQDFIYEDELRAFEAQGIVRLHTAFSRAPGQEKAYVQHAIRTHGDDVWRLLQQEATIFVCGDGARMAPDVRQAFAGLFRERTGVSEADAQAWLTGLVASHRYLEDIWGGS
jgi:cytochrome P450/NADPH-cytochrome P450 reductase